MRTTEQKENFDFVIVYEEIYRVKLPPFSIIIGISNTKDFLTKFKKTFLL